MLLGATADAQGVELPSGGVGASPASPGSPVCDPTLLTPRSGAVTAEAPPVAGSPGTGSSAGVLVAFGGEGPGGLLADTWVFADGAWKLLHPATSPPARYGASFAYDPTARQDILFGGIGAGGLPLDDTWAWDGSNWVELHPAASPLARSAAAFAYGPIRRGALAGMALPVTAKVPAGSGISGTSQAGGPSADFPQSRGDGGHGLVLFGGRSASGAPLAGTWAWNGANWVKLAPATSPPARSAAAFAYGPIPHRSPPAYRPPASATSRGSAHGASQGSPPKSTAAPGDHGHGDILFGGSGTSGLLGGTWAWNGANWVKLAPSTFPSARSAAGFSYDASIHSYVLTGGSGVSVSSAGSGTQQVSLSGTWGFALSNWARLASGATAPGAPSGVSAEGGNGQATVAWSAPGSDGGAPVSAYVVTAIPSGKKVTVTGACPVAVRATIRGLSDGSSYFFTVKALNAAGISPSSGPSAPVTPVGPPLAPTGVFATAGNAEAAVSWVTPADNGKAISSYTVTTSPSCPSCSGLVVIGKQPATSTTVRGLANGTPYTFVVRATNDRGSGPPSTASASVTPSAHTGPPGAVRDLQVLPEAGQVKVRFVPPASNGGSAITSYRVSATPAVSPQGQAEAEPAMRRSEIAARSVASGSGVSPACLLWWSGSCALYPPRTSSSPDPAGTWVLQSASAPPDSVVTDMSCANPEDCTAVGLVSNGTPSISNLPGPLVLVTRDGGASWADIPVPVTATELLGVSCASSSSCVAVGTNDFVSSTGTSLDPVTLFTSDAGATWHEGSIPAGLSALTGVSCPSSSDCFALGYENATATQQASTAVISSTDGGATWQVSASFPALGFSPFVIGGIACAYTSTCLAVGITYSFSTSGTSPATLVAPASVETTDGGATWALSPMGSAVSTSSGAPVPVPVRVSCPSASSCMAVGVSGGFFGQSAPPTPLAWSTSDGGSTWSESQPDAGLPAGASGVLYGVSCPSSGTCYATGFTTASITTSSGTTEQGLPTGPVLEVTTDSGATWSPQDASVPAGEVLGLTSVSCTGSATCEAGGAIGSSTSSFSSGTYSTAILSLGFSCPQVSSGSSSPTSCSSLTASPGAADVILSGLANGTTYVVEVSATNASGATGPVATSSEALVGVTPATPQVSVVPLLQSVYATWQNIAGTATSGPVTSYMVDLESTGQGGQPEGTVQQFSLPSSVDTWTFNSLVTGATYFVYVAAINSAGASGFGISSNVTLAARTSASGRVVALASLHRGVGYYAATSAGYVYTFGDALFYGDLPALAVTPAKPIVGMAVTPDDRGYWLVGADGGVYSFGDAGFYGSIPGEAPGQGIALSGAVTGIAATPSGAGYWLVDSGGGVHPFGDARYFGDLPAFEIKPAKPVVGITAMPGGLGYWLAGADGGVFAFGDQDADNDSAGTDFDNDSGSDSSFYGSLAGAPLNAPVVGIASTPGGRGYWLVAADGGVFSLGSAQFHGSMGGKSLVGPVVAMATTPGGNGYWLAGTYGGIFSFGTAIYQGNAFLPPPPPATPTPAPSSGTCVAGPSGACWGVDTTSVIDQTLAYSAIVASVGTPEFIGRYFASGPMVGTPLQRSEAADIHSHGASILLIVSPNNAQLVGSTVGKNEAQAAIIAAEELGVPSGAAIFRDVEPSYTINSSYIEAWVGEFDGSPYTPGFYENSYSPNNAFPQAYDAAVAASHSIGSKVVLYASEPEPYGKDYTEKTALPWHPATPPQKNTTVAWQYKEPGPLPGYPKVDLDEVLPQYSNLLWGGG